MSGIQYSSPGVFNVLDPWYDSGGGVYVGMSPTATALQNTQVLQAIINIAQASCSQKNPYGATIVFPGHSDVPPQGADGTDEGAEYQLQAPGDGSPAITINCNWPLRLIGTGDAKLVMNIPTETTSGDMFSVATDATGDNIGGITFEDLTIKYPPISGSATYAGIHVTTVGAQNVRLVRVILQDCPIGAWFEETLQCSMLQCTVNYTENIGTGVIVGTTKSSYGAKEMFITDTLFMVASSAPTGSTGLVIQGSDQVFVSNCHLDMFTNGIEIVPGPTGHNAVHLHFTSCAVYTGADTFGNLGHCCLIQPQEASGGGPGSAQVAQVVFTGCFFELGASATINETGGGPGILIDATNGAVDTVRFVSCYSTRWPGQGLKVTGTSSGSHLLPQNIEVMGGMYAGNNFANGSALNAYGIWLDAAAGVRISGVSCVGSYYYIPIDSGSSGPAPVQNVGIYVDNGASDIIISGCDCRNNNDQGILVNGGASEVIIDACDVRGNGTNGILIDGATTAVTDIFIRNCNARGTWSYSAAISISGSVAVSNPSVQVSNCAGYNDQKATINSNDPPTSSGANCAAKNGYYGPSLVTCFIASHAGAAPSLTVNGTAFITPYNSFLSTFLNSAYDTILFSAALPSGSVFTWTGE